MQVYRVYLIAGQENIKQGGTGWFCRKDLLVTAVHVVGNENRELWQDFAPHLKPVVEIGSTKVDLELVEYDPEADIVLFKTETPVPQECVIDVGSYCRDYKHEDYEARGFPTRECGEVFSVTGKIAADHNSERPARKRFQLTVDQTTKKEVPWDGISGAPVLIEGKVIGLVTQVSFDTNTAWAADLAIVQKALLEDKQFSTKIIQPSQTTYSNGNKGELADSIIFVDGNYEIRRLFSHLPGYQLLLSRSMKLSYLLTKNKVLHPLPHFIENPIFAKLSINNCNLFNNGEMSIVSKAGVGFANILDQRQTKYKGQYPDHLLESYTKENIYKLADCKLPNPICLRSLSMTKNIKQQLMADLGSTSQVGSENAVDKETMLSLPQLYQSCSPLITIPGFYNKSREEWIAKTISRSESYGLPLMYDAFMGVPGAPKNPIITKQFGRQLLVLYFSVAEIAYKSFACSIFINPRPAQWQSSHLQYYDLKLFWKILQISNLAQYIDRLPVEAIHQLMYEGPEYLIFRYRYQELCQSQMSTEQLCNKVACQIGSREQRGESSVKAIVNKLENQAKLLAKTYKSWNENL